MLAICISNWNPDTGGLDRHCWRVMVVVVVVIVVVIVALVMVGEWLDAEGDDGGGEMLKRRLPQPIKKVSGTVLTTASREGLYRQRRSCCRCQVCCMTSCDGFDSCLTIQLECLLALVYSKLIYL